MRIATWNVNSLKVRLDHLLGWLQENPIDIVCLQETKLVDEKFPVDALRSAGYEAIYSGQPTYNGVAILYRRDLELAPEDVVIDNPLLPDHQKRLITARFGSMRVTCAYFPNGQSVGSEKYEYKLRWMAALKEWLGQMQASSPLADQVLLGDFNVAPADEDVHDRIPSAKPIAGCCRSACTMPSGSSSSRRRSTAGGTTGCWPFAATPG